jgi:ketosteroid isomerase-like protein
MERRQLILGSLVGIAGFTGRSDAAQKTQGGPQSQQVAEAERSFAATMAKRDATAFAAHISEEAIFMGSSDTPRVIRGRAAIVEGWKQFFDGPTAPFSWEPDIAEVIDSGSMALTSGPVYDPSGKLIGRFNSIWRREPDGRWRVLFDRGAPVCG